MTDKPRERAASIASLALALCLLSVSPASADTFKPTRFDDPVPGKCKPDDCSLREALKAANAEITTNDKVILAKGTYELELPYGGSGTFYESSDFDIWTGVTIRGQGPGKTTIDGNGIDRVIEIGEGIQTVGKARFEDLRIIGGDSGAASALHTSTGGGVVVYGEPLTLDHVVLKGNAAGLGGAIEAMSPKLTILHSTIIGNNASEGGGIHLRSGGGSSPVTLLRYSTVSGNFASKGGGVLADGSATFGPAVPILQAFNSTVAGNMTSAEGGGVMSDNGASVIFSNSTIAYNVADDDNTGGAVGGGVHQHSGAFFNLYDSIVASNSVGSGSTDPACSGNFAGDGDVVTASAGCASLSAATNQFVGSALIGPLAANGGPTKTIEALATSPALGYVDDCPKTDQRGVKRPAVHCDSGAYERKGP